MNLKKRVICKASYLIASDAAYIVAFVTSTTYAHAVTCTTFLHRECNLI